MKLRILTVCTGNICRSPVAAALLQALRPGAGLSSAGLAAEPGRAADPLTAEVALDLGVDLSGHRARRFSAAMGREADLILAMAPRHCEDIVRIAPELTGRTFLLDHWCGATGIPDPYGKPRAWHESVVDAILRATESWAERL
ncbi:hypothetical protein CCR90_05190 [Rhodovulum sulfidophilum]|uniref:low molecular weight protein-tyrosine-phosphatase n=1 Tax=Rhodovulum sulfidophilum TaxID=35806 RepID=UPI00191291AD|nr:low molecular weight protein-tyrosine-phosphatase [Rhodovulum sulfidophilum]MBK5923185.1 hypothetical protein [Rhodovulum sulfidophilum]